ncbi:MAG: hypothetical protein JWR53_721 [Glaciihabitans sp.]|jgi:undecaprenyl-diphosphatase|nr:hypothetical protein [Glaciihabitans sp.]MCU1534240.1 hypothetical protein [Glaciihabitans sp.]
MTAADNAKPPPPNAPTNPVINERRVARLWPVVSASGALILVAALAGVIFYRENNKPFGFELEWMSEIVENRSPFWTAPALVFNALGGGVLASLVVPLLIIAALIVWRRPWSALYFALATALSAGIVQLLKVVMDRPRPTDPLVQPDFGSFPSGHSANAAVMAVTLGIIFGRWWVWAIGGVYTVAMMISRTYLGAHWISDTVGGALVGAGVAIILWAPFAYRLFRERWKPHGPLWKHGPVEPRQAS